MKKSIYNYLVKYNISYLYIFVTLYHLKFEFNYYENSKNLYPSNHHKVCNLFRLSQFV